MKAVPSILSHVKRMRLWTSEHSEALQFYHHFCCTEAYSIFTDFSSEKNYFLVVLPSFNTLHASFDSSLIYVCICGLFCLPISAQRNRHSEGTVE